MLVELTVVTRHSLYTYLVYIPGIHMYSCSVQYTRDTTKYAKLTFEFEDVLVENLDLSLSVLSSDGEIGLGLFQFPDVLLKFLLSL